jgi:hypothetical protein
MGLCGAYKYVHDQGVNLLQFDKNYKFQAINVAYCDHLLRKNHISRAAMAGDPLTWDLCLPVLTLLIRLDINGLKLSLIRLRK